MGSKTIVYGIRNISLGAITVQRKDTEASCGVKAAKQIVWWARLCAHHYIFVYRTIGIMRLK